jgi:hypothetical protein
MTEQAVTETIVDVTSAAKAGLILWNLTARLEATPFQNGLQNRIFPQAVKRCATHGL